MHLIVLVAPLIFFYISYKSRLFFHFLFFSVYILKCIKTQARTCDILLLYSSLFSTFLYKNEFFFGCSNNTTIKMIHFVCLSLSHKDRIFYIFWGVACLLAFAAYNSVSSSNNVTQIHTYSRYTWHALVHIKTSVSPLFIHK